MVGGMDDDPKDVSTRPQSLPPTRDDKPGSDKGKPKSMYLRSSGRDLDQEPDFGPRYRVIGVLGKGGMGEVYRAYDTELRSEVAIKIVRSERDDHPEALARFRREIALARKVTSANVLRVYDLAEHAGLRFLTMELVDGEDLAAMMKRDRHMPLERVLSIVRQVCAGLAAAHAQGVVHRDLKPANVLVDNSGNVRVADFGLARSIDDSGVTASGAILGSPAYMSPEQVKGAPVDERSDIYSLGVMLYQLLAGEPPFRGLSPHAVMEMRLHKKPPPMRELNPDVPPYLEPIVARCLALAPEDRYRTVRELIDDLDRASHGSAATPALPAQPDKHERRWLAPAIAAGAAATIVGVVAFIAWPGKSRTQVAPAAAVPTTSSPSPKKAQIKVLTLGIENRTSDPVFDAVDHVFTKAMDRSVAFEAIPPGRLRQIAAELIPDKKADERLGEKLAARDHADVVMVRGSIVPKGQEFTISITAKDTNNQVVYTQALDARLPDVVPVIGRLASGLRMRYGETVKDAERDLTGMSLNLDADHEYVLGAAMLRTNDLPGAIEHMQSALAKDPGFALAHFQLGVMFQNSGREVESGEQFKLALKFVDQMFEHDQLRFLSLYYSVTTQDFDRALDAYKQLLAKWPNDMAAKTNIPLVYLWKGDAKKAAELGAIVAREHPGDLPSVLNAAEYEFFAGMFERAVVDLRKLVEGMARSPAAAYQYLALASVFTGHRAEAVASFEQLRKADPSLAATALADFAIAEARLAEAEQLLRAGIADDHKANRTDAEEIKQAMLAELLARRGDKAGARAAAALVTRNVLRLLSAAVVQLATGDDKRAAATAKKFAGDVSATKRAVAQFITGEGLRVHGKPQQAMLAIQEGLKLSDLPIGHFLLARAALDAKRFPEAYSELQLCVAKQAQLAMGSDDVPTYRNVPLVTYYLARAREGIGNADATAMYAAYLAMLHDPDPKDPFVIDARRHAH